MASLFLSFSIASFVFAILRISFIYDSSKQSLDSFQRSDAEEERYAYVQDWLPGSKTVLLSRAQAAAPSVHPEQVHA